jgi:hypothetical protein
VGQYGIDRAGGNVLEQPLERGPVQVAAAVAAVVVALGLDSRLNGRTSVPGGQPHTGEEVQMRIDGTDDSVQANDGRADQTLQFGLATR